MKGHIEIKIPFGKGELHFLTEMDEIDIQVITELVKLLKEI